MCLIFPFSFVLTKASVIQILELPLCCCKMHQDKGGRMFELGEGD